MSQNSFSITMSCPNTLLAALLVAFCVILPASAGEMSLGVSDSRISDQVITPKPNKLPERPRPIVEIGDRFLGVGPLSKGFTLPTGAVWQPSFLVFGSYRSALQAVDRGGQTDSEWMSLVWQTFKEALGKLFKQLAPLIGILTDIVEFLAKAISVVISFVEFITRLLAEIGKILFGLGDMEEATEQAGGETIQQFYRSAFGSLQGGLESGKKWLQTQIQRLQNFMGMESEIIQDVGEDTGEQ